MTEQYAAPPSRRFRRTMADRRLAGICGGLGLQLGVDPVVFRVLVVAAGLVEGSIALGAYVLIWLVTRDDGRGPRPSPALLVVGGLIAVAAYRTRVTELGVTPLERWLVPVATVAIALLVPLLPRRQPRLPTPAGSGASEPALPTWWEVRSRPSQRKPRSPLPGVTVGLAGVAAGTAVVAGATARTVAVTALLVVAAGLLVGTVRGNGRPLVPVAAAVGLLLATSHYATVPAATAASGTYIRPASIDELRDHTALTGAVTVDLSETEWVAGGGTIERRIDVVAGHVVVILPDFFREGPRERLRPSFSFDAFVWVGAYEKNVGSRDSGRGIARGSRRFGGGSDDIVHLDLFVRVRFGTLELRDAAA